MLVHIVRLIETAKDSIITYELNPNLVMLRGFKWVPLKQIPSSAIMINYLDA